MVSMSSCKFNINHALCMSWPGDWGQMPWVCGCDLKPEEALGVALVQAPLLTNMTTRTAAIVSEIHCPLCRTRLSPFHSCTNPSLRSRGCPVPTGQLGSGGRSAFLGPVREGAHPTLGSRASHSGMGRDNAPSTSLTTREVGSWPVCTGSLIGKLRLFPNVVVMVLTLHLHLAQ